MTARVVAYGSPEHLSSPAATDTPAFAPLTGSVLRGGTGPLPAPALPAHAGTSVDGPRNFVVSAALDRARAEEREQAVQAAHERETAHRAELQGAYDTGLADGRELEARDGVALLRSLADSVTEVRVDAADAAAAQLRADVADLLDVAAEVATWLLERELSADSGVLLRRLTSAIDGLVSPDNAVVYANPGDIATLRAWRDQRTIDGLPGSFELDADPTVPSGQARLRCDGQVADLTAAAAVRRALAAIRAEVSP